MRLTTSVASGSSRLQLAALDGRHIAHGADQMLVRRVVVIHVELHQGHGMVEGRHEFAQHARFVHPPQRAFGIAPRGEDIEEQPVGFGLVVAHLFGDEVERARDRAQRVGVHIHALASAMWKMRMKFTGSRRNTLARASRRPFST
jgi:hypothetical protein